MRQLLLLRAIAQGPPPQAPRKHLSRGSQCGGINRRLLVVASGGGHLLLRLQSQQCRLSGLASTADPSSSSSGSAGSSGPSTNCTWCTRRWGFMFSAHASAGACCSCGQHKPSPRRSNTFCTNGWHESTRLSPSGSGISCKEQRSQKCTSCPG